MVYTRKSSTVLDMSTPDGDQVKEGVQKNSNAIDDLFAHLNITDSGIGAGVPSIAAGDADKVLGVKADESGLEYKTYSVADERVKVSSNATTHKYLEEALAANAPLSLSVDSEGGDESLSLSLSLRSNGGLILSGGALSATLASNSGLRLDVNGFSLDSGTSAYQAVQLDASGRLPAVSGENLVNLPAPDLSSLDWLIQSTMRNTMDRLVRNNESKVQLGASVIDEFEDQTGIDADSSTNEIYGATVKAYTPSTSAGSGANLFTGGTRLANPGATSVSYAFDGVQGNYCHTQLTNTGGYVGYQKSEPFVMNRYKFATYYDGAGNDHGAKSWRVEGWDGAQWVTLDERTNMSGRNGYYEFSFSNSTAYARYRIYVTAVINASAACLVDAFEGYYDQTDDMLLQSIAYTATTEPGNMTVLLRASVNGTLGTDLVVSGSRDDGTTWTAGTISKIAEEGEYDYYEAKIDLSSQPTGTDMKWRIETKNNAGGTIAGVGMVWGQ